MNYKSIEDITEKQLKDMYMNMDYEEIADEDQDTMQEANYYNMVFKCGDKFYAIWITQHWGSIDYDNIYLDMEDITEVKKKTVTKVIWEAIND